VFDNEHSLHLWKRHSCTSTFRRNLMDWREQVTTWRDLRGFLYSHSDTVCLLIQWNCTELQSSINTLTRVAWLFDHRVGHLQCPAIVCKWIWGYFRVRPFSHWGDATAIQSRKKSLCSRLLEEPWVRNGASLTTATRCDDDSPWIKSSRLFSWSNRNRVT
jgi:hypothetical protein